MNTNIRTLLLQIAGVIFAIYTGLYSYDNIIVKAEKGKPVLKGEIHSTISSFIEDIISKYGTDMVVVIISIISFIFMMAGLKSLAAKSKGMFLNLERLFGIICFLSNCFIFGMFFFTVLIGHEIINAEEYFEKAIEIFKKICLME